MTVDVSIDYLSSVMHPRWKKPPDMGIVFALAIIWIAVFGLAANFTTVAGTIYGGGIAASVPIALFWATRWQSRRQATLDLYKEYYSIDFAALRGGASKFMKKHKGVDWSANDPYRLGEGDDDLAGYAAIVRFFHRFAILYDLGEINRNLAQNLFSREVGYWYGKLFEPMEARSGMFVLPSILNLARKMKILDGSSRFQEGYATSRRIKPPEMEVDPQKTLKSVKERWGTL